MNPSEGFRMIEFSAAAATVASGIRSMLERLESSKSVSEPYIQTFKKHTVMYQFRPDDVAADEAEFMLQAQHTCDNSTNLRRRSPPPKEIVQLRHLLEAALPTLKAHYRCGWVQVNHSKLTDELCAHVDQRGWGDIIVTFTLHRITVTLERMPRVDGTIASKSRFEVPANCAYLLAGHARYLAKHKVLLPDGRIGVVFRFYLKDLCALGARQISKTCVKSCDYAGQLKGLESSIVCARWPSDTDPAKPHGLYCSCYPAVLIEVDTSSGLCKLRFFVTDEDVTGHFEHGEGLLHIVAANLVLIDTTQWYFEPRDPLARFFRPPLELMASRSKRPLSQCHDDGLLPLSRKVPRRRLAKKKVQRKADCTKTLLEAHPATAQHRGTMQKMGSTPAQIPLRRREPLTALNFQFSVGPTPTPSSILSVDDMAAFLVLKDELKLRSQLPADSVFRDPTAADFFQGRHHPIALAKFAKAHHSELFQMAQVDRAKLKIIALTKTQTNTRPTRRHKASSPEVGMNLLYWCPPIDRVPGLWMPATIIARGCRATTFKIMAAYGMVFSEVLVTFDDPIPGKLRRVSAGVPKELDYQFIDRATYDALKPRFSEVWHNHHGPQGHANYLMQSAEEDQLTDGPKGKSCAS